MFKDELRSIEQYTQELEAVKYYHQIKRERDSLAAEAAQLRERLVQLEGQLKGEISAEKGISSQLAKTEAEVKELAGKLDEAQRELSSVKDFKVKLPQEGDLSLEEMRARFLEAGEEEVERRAKERFGELKKDIRSQMPTLVHKRLMVLLRRPGWPPEIERVIDSKAKQMAESTLRDKERWPEWFKALYLEQVNGLVVQGLDSEFEKRAWAEAERRLENLKAERWKEYTARKARELISELKGMIRQLQGTWWFTCDRCGRRLAVEIGPSGIGSLLKGEVINVACTTCIDPAPFPFILSTVPHQAGSVTLESLLQIYMGNVHSTE